MCSSRQAEARDHVAEEAADLLYFMFVACAKVGPLALSLSPVAAADSQVGVNMVDIERVLDKRSLKVGHQSARR